MILAQQGVMLPYKSNIRSPHFCNAYKDIQNHEEIKALQKVLHDSTFLKLIKAKNKKPKHKDVPSWEKVAPPDIVTLLGTFDIDQAERSNNIVRSRD